MCSVFNRVLLALLLSNIRACPTLRYSTYDILGPFPSSGNHLHGGDAVQAFGDIHDLLKNKSIEYSSELVYSGRIKWETVKANKHGIVEYSYEESALVGLMYALGLGVIQNFATWAVTKFEVEESGKYLISCGNVATYTIDGVELVGDPYAISSWWGPNGWIWLPIQLEEGEHTLALRFHWKFQCRIRCTKVDPIYVLVPDAQSIFNPTLVFILPSIVDGSLTSPYLSIPVTNGYDYQTTKWNVRVASLKNGENALDVHDPTSVQFIKAPVIVPGQIYPLGLDLTLQEVPNCETIQIGLRFKVEFADGLVFNFRHKVDLKCTSFTSNSTYGFTYLDVDNSIQFANLRPPSHPCDGPHCSLILALHGSDVDPGSPTWTNAILPQKHAWILMPSNRDKYGYDWQGIGQWSAVEAMNYFFQNLPGVKSSMVSTYRPNRSRILFLGHSMGGHGCLVFSTLYPDWSIGSLCAAAWIRFDHYVQEFQGIQSSYLDSTLANVLQSSVAEYHPDLLVSNMKGIPFMGRMGSKDQNVSPWNLRRFGRLVDEVNGQPGFAQISEVMGRPHWWGDVLKDEIVQQFLETVLTNQKPSLPSQFTIRALGLLGTGRGGIQILQLQTPFTLAEIKVNQIGETTIFETKNVKRFEISDPIGSSCVIDSQSLSCVASSQGHFKYNPLHQLWEVSYDRHSWKLHERHRLNAGPMRQVFHGPCMIIYGTKVRKDEVALEKMSVHVANLLMARGHSLIHIKKDSEITLVDLESNMILIGGPQWNKVAQSLLISDQFQTTITKTCEFSKSGFKICSEDFSSPGIGAAIYGSYAVATKGVKINHPLDQWSNEESSYSHRSMVLITGTDLDGIKRAVKLLPTSPNSETPEYIVVDSEFGWKGAGAVLAAGFWGTSWECRPDISYSKSPHNCPAESHTLTLVS